MKLLVSGEGPTDLGICPQREEGEGEALHPGPMLLLLDRLIERWVGYSRQRP